MKMSLPKPALSLEHTLVPSDGDVHNPVVEVTAESLANKNSNLHNVNMADHDTIALCLQWEWRMCRRWRIVRIGIQAGWAAAKTLRL